MRILITGAGGMLGHALAPVLEESHQVVGLSREDCDLCDEGAVREIFHFQKPDMVVHLAAFTNVDACELEPEKAKAWNELAILNVAMEAGKQMLHVVREGNIFLRMANLSVVRNSQLTDK